jgi:hypothetical protein
MAAAKFHRPVDPDRSGLDKPLGLATGSDRAGDLQEGAELDGAADADVVQLSTTEDVSC